MRARIEVEVTNAEEVERAMVTAVLRAGTGAVAKATRRLEQDLEAQTRTAARGKAWRAWKSESFPRAGQPAYEPVGRVFANGGARSKGMLSFWSLPGVNRARGNPFLAVPLRAALGTSRGRHISPAQWERIFKAELRPLFRPGETPLLVADGALFASGFTPRDKAAAKLRGGQAARQSGTVAVFALIDQQPHANRVSISSAVNRAREFMVADLGRSIARLS